MPLSPGARLGPYEIVGSLGVGGMGEVYRARDSKLNRFVALKVLPDRLLGDPDRLRRLQREAQLLAALNHPRIATLHGLEESGGTSALVMELVDGEDLSQRVARGPLPPAEALPIARQIAEALDAAHRQGIVHRDLKPANIKLRADGSVKVLDFGLAKAAGPWSPTPDESPTITSPAAMTMPGMVLGTAAYMSPEQARGRDVDQQADVWAFGCVLYELLTGRSAFRGESVSDTLGAVMHREPDWTLLPANTPVAVRRLLRRCLEKDPRRRLRDIADAILELDDAGSTASEDAAPPVTSTTSRRRPAVSAALAVVALLGAGAGGWFLRQTPEVAETRLEITTPPGVDASIALSTDGRQIVFAAQVDGTRQLWLRSLDRTDARPLAGTERGTLPFWSPDGRSIAFFVGTTLKRVSIDGGSPQTLAVNCAVPGGGTWAPDGTILFSDNPGGGIRRTNVNGDASTAVTQVSPSQQRGHHYPVFLPDHRHFLFFATGSPEGRGVWFGDLGGSPPLRLLDADGPAAYAASGHLLFVRDRKLHAQRFDPARGVLSGDVQTIQDPVRARNVLSASAAGPVAYRGSVGDSGERQLSWVDRSGRELNKVVYPDTAGLGPALSGDGRRVAVFRLANANMDIWSYDTTRRLWERITYDAGDDIYPLWSPDNRSIIYAGVRNAAPLSLFQRLLSDPPERERELLKTPGTTFPVAWSPDGRYLLFDQPDPKRAWDIWGLSLTEPDAKPFEVVATEARESQAQFSPDGKWIAYQSDKTGRDEIYVRPFPGPGADVHVSPDGGTQVRWNPNPKVRELFFLGADDRLMAASLRLLPDGTVDVSAPVALFATQIGSTVPVKYRPQYDVSPDGQSFVLNSIVLGGDAPPIVVMLNWKPAAR